MNDLTVDDFLKLDTHPEMLKSKYIIDENGNVQQATSLSGWSEWLGNPDTEKLRKVAYTSFGVGDDGVGIYVSTVFLGLDHGFPELLELYGTPLSEYKPTLWETMVFGSPLDGAMERYTCIENAKNGHMRMVERVVTTLIK